MCCEESEVSWPPLDSSIVWSVDDEFLLLLVKSRCGSQSSNIGSVADLSLSVCSQYLHVSYFWNPFFLLLIVHHCLASIQEHRVVKANWRVTVLCVGPMYQMWFMINKPLFLSMLIGIMDLPHHIFHLLLSCHIIVFMSLIQFFVVLHEINGCIVSFNMRHSNKMNSLTIIVLLVSLLLKRRINNFVFPASLNFRHVIVVLNIIKETKIK